MANIKFIAVSRGLRGIVDYVTNREKTVEQLISGVNCVARTAVPEFEAVKKQFRKTEGRGYYHIVQAFAPDDPLDFTTAHELGVKLAEHFKGYQCIVVTHMNTAHIHNHIIMNSVNFETGMKFHQSAREMQQVKDYCSQLCREYGLSVTESKADPFRIPTWKRRLTDHIKEAMEQSRTQQEFVAYMNVNDGIGVFLIQRIAAFSIKHFVPPFRFEWVKRSERRVAGSGSPRRKSAGNDKKHPHRRKSLHGRFGTVQYGNCRRLPEGIGILRCPGIVRLCSRRGLLPQH